MASVSRTLRVIFDGSVAGLAAASAEAEAIVRRFEDTAERVNAGLARGAKAFVAIGAIGNVIAVVAGVTAALSQLLPAALILPGALLVGAAAMATFKIATAGVADALSGDAEAMAKLSPAAREFVRAVQSLGPAFDRLKRSVQEKFFVGFAQDVRDIGRNLLPTLGEGLGDVAEQMNVVARSAANVLKGSAFRSDLRIILASTAGFFREIGAGIGDLISGIVGLGAVGSTYLPRLGEAIGAVAQRFREWVDNGIESGEIERFIDDALQGFRDLGTVIGNVGAIIGTIFDGLSTGAGDDFLATLAASTTAVRELFEEIETQQSLATLGETLAAIAAIVNEVFVAAFRAALPIIEAVAPAVQAVAEAFGTALVGAIRTVGPLVEGLGNFLSANRQVLADLAPIVLVLAGAFGALRILTSVARWVGAAVVALGGLARVAKIGAFVGIFELARAIDEANVAAAGGPENLAGFDDTLHNIIGAGEQLLTLDLPAILADISAEVDQLTTSFERGESPAGAFWKKITESFQRDFLDFFSTTAPAAISDIGTKIGESFQRDFVDVIVATFTSAVDGIAEFFNVTIPATVTAGIEGLVSFVTTESTKIGTAFTEGITTAGQGVIDFFVNLPYNIGFAIGSLAGILLAEGERVGTEFKTGITTAVDAVVTYFTELPGRAVGALAGLAASLVESAAAAGEGFRLKVVEWVTGVLAYITGVPARVGEGLSGLGPAVIAKAEEAGTGFIASVTAWATRTIAEIGTLPARAGAAIAGLAGVLIAKAKEAGDGFVRGITEFGNTALAYVTSLPGKIRNAIGNLGGLLVAAGRSLIDGLLRGIKAGYEAMLDFVRGIADGIAANKGPLPYDRRVLVPAGLALMSGLLRGIREGYGNVAAFVDTIAAGMGERLTAAISADPLALADIAVSSPANRTEDVVSLLRQLLAQDRAVTVDVRIGDRSITEFIAEVVELRDRATTRAVSMGARGATV